MRNLFACFCPKCKKKLFRRKVKINKPTTCDSCKFVIKNPYKSFYKEKT